MNRNNMVKYAWANEVWTHSKDFPALTHVDWDRLYNVNRLQEGRSKYAQEERRTDQRDLNFAFNFKWRATPGTTLTGGLEAKTNRTEHFKSLVIG